MITDARTDAAHNRRWALWVFMFVGVVLHWSLCPPNVHAGVLSATTRTCVSSAAGMSPPEAESRTEVPDSDRAGDADRPCAPAPRPHHHAPCGVMNHRGSSPQRSLGPSQAGVWSPLLAPYAGESAGPGNARPSGWSSRPPVRRSGAGLLIDLCSSRT